MLQLESDDDSSSNMQVKSDQKKETPEESQPQGVASIKAPTDPKYLKKVQINNEKPPVKNIAPPIQRSFVQVASQIKLDMMADEAANVMTDLK